MAAEFKMSCCVNQPRLFCLVPAAIEHSQVKYYENIPGGFVHVGMAIPEFEPKTHIITLKAGGVGWDESETAFWILAF